VLESPIAWATHALCIVIFVGFGVSLIQPLAKKLLPGVGFKLDLGPGTILGCTALEPDIGFYIFGLWVSCFALAAGPSRSGQNGTPHIADR